MSISFEKLRIALKSVGVPVTRDKAEKGTNYPYIVYSNVSQGKKMASSKVHRRMPYYQISFYTTGTEKDLIALENALEEAGIPYTDFVGIQGDENDDTVTNFYTYVRCIEDGK
ncbi:hypothetical protein O2N11_000387 [Enterococcus faecalis]|uniref:hypothetical protein n=1 Tax=Enterococcus faecalis TaxID=1351 RepID=UPI0018A97DD8|nr:hypothetical protein [Enterococcus faecalis]EGO7769055.1 hypothetical protein [Enterococcus faecalis]EKG2070526.1 hypothetical protein [Enterococcus faecalis]